MASTGRDDGPDTRPRLHTDSAEVAPARDGAAQEADVVFDFSGLAQPQVTDLALILTARLSAAPGDRVWARSLPPKVWHLLRALGLDHMFRIYPGPGSERN